MDRHFQQEEEEEEQKQPDTESQSLSRSNSPVGLSEVVVDSNADSDGHLRRIHSFNGAIHHADNSAKRVHWDTQTLILAYKTLGVVFGGLVTSPLYVYPSMQLNSPTEDDYLGIYSLIFWTLTLIGVVKYASIALKANDHGEGGTFAVYSLLCRNLNIGILSSKSVRPNSSPSYSTRKDKVESQSWLERYFERSLAARRLLLFITMLGTCMLIGDGILTPAISVLSAMTGVRAPFPSVSSALLEALSAVILIALFLMQKFGTSRVSFLFSPIMGAWTLTTPMIGIYSIIHNYPSVFKAISPHFMFGFFLRKGKGGWLLLSGTVLCITGSEALFADLGHFNERSIQIAFLLIIYPSLVLTYAGQTAYLIRNPNDHGDGFYKFIPKSIYWPMFIVSTLAAIVASQSLISATFSIIKQSMVLDYFPRVRIVHTSSSKEGEVYSPEINYILMVLCVAVILIFGDGQDIGNAFGVVVSLVMLITTILLALVMIIIWRTPMVLVVLFFAVFFVMEGVYVSAVFTKVPEGGWIPFAISIILAFIMFGWFYGRQRKLQYELTHKITLHRLQELLSDPNVQRVPGLCFFYTNIQDGLTPILGHYIKSTKSLHNVTIFTTLRYLLVPKVASNERILIKKMGLDGVYGCVLQYGYADSLNLGDNFVHQVTDALLLHIEDCSGSIPSDPQQRESEISSLEEAKRAGIVHIRGKTRFYIGKDCGWFDRIMLAFYEVMHGNCRSALPSLGVSPEKHIEVGMLYEA